MLRTFLAGCALILIPQCAIAQPAALDPAGRPNESYDGGPTRTLDLSAIGASCGTLEIDLADRVLTCSVNSSRHRLTNVDNVIGPLAAIQTGIYGDERANRLVAQSSMTSLIGRGGDDTLILPPIATGIGGGGTDRWEFVGPDRVIKSPAYWPTYRDAAGALRRYPARYDARGRRIGSYSSAALKAMGIVKAPATTSVFKRAVDIEPGEIVTRR